MSEFEKKARAVAEAIGAFLEVAGKQAKALADVGLMLLVEADSCKGMFRAEVWSKIVEEQKVVEGEVVEETEFKGAPETQGEVKGGTDVSKASLTKAVKTTPYLA